MHAFSCRSWVHDQLSTDKTLVEQGVGFLNLAELEYLRRRKTNTLASQQRNGFVHQSEIQMEGFRDLAEGQRVEFETKQGQKGLQASQVRKI